MARTLTKILTASILTITAGTAMYTEETPPRGGGSGRISAYIEIDDGNNYRELCYDYWKDGKIVVTDFWGRFVTLELTEKNRMKARKLAKNPYADCSVIWYAFPEVNIIYGCSGWLEQIFCDTETKKTTHFEPIFTRRYAARKALLLDSKKKTFLLIYGGMATYERYDYFIYDYPNNKILRDPFKAESDFKKDLLVCRLGDNLFLSQERYKENPERYPIFKNKFYIYDFEKEERIDNELTECLSRTEEWTYGTTVKSMSLEKNFAITVQRTLGFDTALSLFITWDDGFKNVRAEPFFSPQSNTENSWVEKVYNDEWVVFFTPADERTFKVGFSKTGKDSRIPVFIDDVFSWSKWNPQDFMFISHPTYGLCCLVEIEDEDENLYHRLYKMSDVQAEIDRLTAEE